MAKNDKKSLDSVETWIGVNTSFKGDIKSDKSVRIDGNLIGNIEQAQGVIVGENAKITGNINTKYIVVAGCVEGDIVASDGIELLDKSKVKGNLQTTILTINEGALFDGNSSMIKQDENSATSSSKSKK